MGNLSDIQIRQWIKQGQPLAKSDGDGLTFTLSAKGMASWVLRYRMPGAKSQKELTIGRYPDMTLQRARQEAAGKRLEVNSGIDVARVKQQMKREVDRAWAVSRLAEDYLEKAQDRLHKSTVDGRRQQFRDYIKPIIGALPVKDVTPSDIVEVTERALVKSQHIARLVLVLLRELFSHAIARHVIETDPCAHVKAKSVLGPRPVNRTRIALSEQELREVLPALPEIGRENELMVKVLLATAVRIGELVNAEWSDVDLERRLWRVPPENIKGRKVRAARGEEAKEFIIPITEQVLELFIQLKDLAFGSRYVMPIRARRGEGEDRPMEATTLNAALNVFCDSLGDKCRRFTPHDLRSTARSHFSALGVDLLIAERCLNHSLGGLVAVYDQHDYLAERRRALDCWSSFLQACELGRPWKGEGLRNVA